MDSPCLQAAVLLALEWIPGIFLAGMAFGFQRVGAKCCVHSPALWSASRAGNIMEEGLVLDCATQFRGDAAPFPPGFLLPTLQSTGLTSRTLLSPVLLEGRGRSKWEMAPGCGDAELPFLFPEDVKKSQSIGTQHLWLWDSLVFSSTDSKCLYLDTCGNSEASPSNLCGPLPQSGCGLFLDGNIKPGTSFLAVLGELLARMNTWISASLG